MLEAHGVRLKQRVARRRRGQGSKSSASQSSTLMVKRQQMRGPP